MAVNGGGVLVSGLSVGSLVISASTTVAEFSAAVIANNAGWQVGDQLTFFLGRQTVDAVTNIPRATLTPNKVVMDVVDETPLWSVVSAAGFTSVEGVQGNVLGMNAVLLAGAAAWVHSRETGTGALKVSTQFFYVENAALASYQTSAALTASANSYGGINTSEVYLQPGTGNTVLGAGAAVQDSGDETPQSQGGDETPQSQGDSSPEQGSSEGGSDSGGGSGDGGSDSGSGSGDGGSGSDSGSGSGSGGSGSGGGGDAGSGSGGGDE